MTFPPSAPWSGIGQLESEISDLRSAINGKANDYELRDKVDRNEFNQANHRLDNMEHSLGEIRTQIDELLSWKQEIQENELKRVC